MPLVCTIDNAIDVFLSGGVVGALLATAFWGVLLVLSKWNSL